jgi:hypothetical protein
MSSDVRYQILIDGEADPDLTAEAIEITVTQTIEGPTTFSIRFATDVCDGDVAFMDDERVKPSGADTLLSVIIVIDGRSFCIAHGIATRRQGSFVEGGPGSWLEITGTDRRAQMDREHNVDVHTGKASERVEQILKRYHFSTDIAETTIEYSEDTHTLVQHETDLAFVTALAGQNDMHFWIDFEVDSGGAVAPGGFSVSAATTAVTEIARFKPSPPRAEDAAPFSIPVILAPNDAPTIKLNSGDGCSNVAAFAFDADAEAPNQTGLITRVDFDSANEDTTDIPSATTEPLGDEQSNAKARSRRVVTAGSVEEARIVNRAALNDASWSVSATVETSAHALRGLVKAHDLIKLEGGGKVIQGDYFVKSVTHNINPADHKLSLQLLRNALGA